MLMNNHDTIQSNQYKKQNLYIYIKCIIINYNIIRIVLFLISI